MNTYDVIQLINSIFDNGLTSIQKMIIQAAWENQTYKTISSNSYYSPEYIRITAAHLWQELSDKLGRPVKKNNFRDILELPESVRKLEQLKNELIFKQKAVEVLKKKPTVHPPSVNLKSHFYVPRSPLEEIATNEIQQPGSCLYFVGSQKIGKTSLVMQILERSDEKSYTSLYFNLKQIYSDSVTSLNELLMWLSQEISQKLNLELAIPDFFSTESDLKTNFTRYWEEQILPHIKQPLILALDEINSLWHQPEIAEEFMLLFQFLHQKQTQFKLWQNLRLILVSSLDTLHPFPASNTPTTVGILLQLSPFNLTQIEKLAQRYGLTWFEGKAAQKLMTQVGGNPYLLQVTLSDIVNSSPAPLEQQERFESLLTQNPGNLGIYQNHLRTLLETLETEPQLQKALIKILTHTIPPELDVHLRLQLENLGLIEPDNYPAKISCQLYSRYFLEYYQTVPRHPKTKQKFTPISRWSELYSTSKIEASLTSISVQSLGKNALVDYLKPLILPEEKSPPVTQAVVTTEQFKTYLNQTWQQFSVEKSPLSLILCKVDSFDKYCAIYGQEAGQQCLNRIQQSICSFLTASSYYLAEYEQKTQFVILLPQTLAMSAFFTAEKIRQLVKQLAIPCQEQGLSSISPMITVSLGVACTTPTSSLSPQLMLEATKQALRQSQQQGGDVVKLSSTFNVGFFGNIELEKLGCNF